MEDSTNPAVPPAIRCCIGFFFFDGGGGGGGCCADEALLLFVFVSVELMFVACNLFSFESFSTSCVTNFGVFKLCMEAARYQEETHKLTIARRTMHDECKILSLYLHKAIHMRRDVYIG